MHDGEQPGGGAELAGGGQHVVQAGQYGARQVRLPTVSSTASEGVVLSFHANATALATALIPAEELEISGRANCGSVASASDSGDPLLRERLNPGAALLRERCPGRGSDGDARVTHLKSRAGGPELGAVIAGRATSPRSIASSAG